MSTSPKSIPHRPPGGSRLRGGPSFQLQVTNEASEDERSARAHQTFVVSGCLDACVLTRAPCTSGEVHSPYQNFKPPRRYLFKRRPLGALRLTPPFDRGCLPPTKGGVLEVERCLRPITNSDSPMFWSVPAFGPSLTTRLPGTLFG